LGPGSAPIATQLASLKSYAVSFGQYISQIYLGTGGTGGDLSSKFGLLALWNDPVLAVTTVGQPAMHAACRAMPVAVLQRACILHDDRAQFVQINSTAIASNITNMGLWDLGGWLPAAPGTPELLIPWRFCLAPCRQSV
jgi:hypothetical protein